MQRVPLPWLWLLFLLFIGSSGEVSAEVATLSTPPQGIQTLGVEISGIQRDYGRYGLDPAKLRARVIRQLEEAGFTIVPAEENRISPPDALLQININLVRAYFGYPYGIAVKLVQKVPLAAPPGGLAPIVTWSKSQTGVVRLPELSRLNDYTVAVVAQFIEAVPPASPAAP
jgi:hypothetical protein